MLNRRERGGLAGAAFSAVKPILNHRFSRLPCLSHVLGPARPARLANPIVERHSSVSHIQNKGDVSKVIVMVTRIMFWDTLSETHVNVFYDRFHMPGHSGLNTTAKDSVFVGRRKLLCLE